jgi:hypothetical protein
MPSLTQAFCVSKTPPSCAPGCAKAKWELAASVPQLIAKASNAVLSAISIPYTITGLRNSTEVFVLLVSVSMDTPVPSVTITMPKR